MGSRSVVDGLCFVQEDRNIARISCPRPPFARPRPERPLLLSQNSHDHLYIWVRTVSTSHQPESPLTSRAVTDNCCFYRLECWKRFHVKVTVGSVLHPGCQFAAPAAYPEVARRPPRLQRAVLLRHCRLERFPLVRNGQPLPRRPHQAATGDCVVLRQQPLPYVVAARQRFLSATASSCFPVGSLRSKLSSRTPQAFRGNLTPTTCRFLRPIPSAPAIRCPFPMTTIRLRSR